MAATVIRSSLLFLAALRASCECADGDLQCPQHSGLSLMQRVSSRSASERATLVEDVQKLGDTCYHVFIDAGSNKGVHGRFIYEPEKYPQARFIAKFDEAFGGDRRSQDMCVFAFEPNPLHREHQVKTMDIYNKLGWRYHYLPVAVGDAAGQMTFYRNKNWGLGGGAEDLGFSASAVNRSAPEAEAGAVDNVTVVDFAAWLEEHIFSRRIPPQGSKNVGKPTVLMKMDIEGSEYRTMLHLLARGSACKLDRIIGETHARFAPIPLKSGQLATPEAANLLMAELNGVLQSADCASFEEFDDESYRNDPAPYPASP